MLIYYLIYCLILLYTKLLYVATDITIHRDVVCTFQYRIVSTSIHTVPTSLTMVGGAILSVVGGATRIVVGDATRSVLGAQQ
jgi:hypothetical protein